DLIGNVLLLPGIERRRQARKQRGGAVNLDVAEVLALTGFRAVDGKVRREKGRPTQANSATWNCPLGNRSELNFGSGASWISNPIGFSCEATVSTMLWRSGFGSLRPILIVRRWPLLTRMPSRPTTHPSSSSNLRALSGC